MRPSPAAGGTSHSAAMVPIRTGTTWQAASPAPLHPMP